MTTAALSKRLFKLEQAVGPDDNWAGWTEDKLQRYVTLGSLSVHGDATEDEEREFEELQRRVPPGVRGGGRSHPPLFLP